MANSAKRKVDQSLQYRWGIVGVVLALAGLVWFAHTSGILKNFSDTREPNNVKIVCPRCEGVAERKTNCSLCRGTGIIWVDKTKYLSSEVSPAP